MKGKFVEVAAHAVYKSAVSHVAAFIKNNPGGLDKIQSMVCVNNDDLACPEALLDAMWYRIRSALDSVGYLKSRSKILQNRGIVGNCSLKDSAGAAILECNCRILPFCPYCFYCRYLVNPCAKMLATFFPSGISNNCKPFNGLSLVVDRASGPIGARIGSLGERLKSRLITEVDKIDDPRKGSLIEYCSSAFGAAITYFDLKDDLLVAAKSNVFVVEDDVVPELNRRRDFKLRVLSPLSPVNILKAFCAFLSYPLGLLTGDLDSAIFVSEVMRRRRRLFTWGLISEDGVGVLGRDYGGPRTLKVGSSRYKNGK